MYGVQIKSVWGFPKGFPIDESIKTGRELHMHTHTQTHAHTLSVQWLPLWSVVVLLVSVLHTETFLHFIYILEFSNATSQEIKFYSFYWKADETNYMDKILYLYALYGDILIQ